jgi:hypothetical protein
MTEYVPGGSQPRLRVVPNVGGKVLRKRRFQREMAGVHQLKHDEGEDGLAERRRIEHGVFVDGVSRARQSNAMAQIVMRLAVADDGRGNAGYVAGRQKTAEGRCIHDPHVANVAVWGFPFQMGRCAPAV